MDNYNYPVGSDTNDAPWNYTEQPEKEIEVLVSITLSKTVKVKVSDYKITDCGKDTENDYFEEIDYSDCDLRGAVENQIVLPDEAYEYIKINTQAGFEVRKDLSGWNVDEFTCIKE